MALLHYKVAQPRANRGPMPDALQGVTKDRIRTVLQFLDLGSNADLVDCTFANQTLGTNRRRASAPSG